LLVGLAVTACAVGPDYRRPDAPAVDRFTAEPLPVATASSPVGAGDAQRFLQGREVPARWWTTFGNPELTRRVNTALANSPSVVSAQAALRQAQETARAAGGSLFPAIDAGAGVTRQKPSLLNSAGSAAGTGPFTLYNASVSVGYTLDLFGGVRRGIEAQLAQQDYQQAQLDSTYLTLAGNVVTASLQEASLREQVRATEQIVDWQRKTLDIARKQQQIGATALYDTLAVRSQLATTEASLPPLRAQLAATRNQLATYLGTTPELLDMSPLTLVSVRLPQDIPVSLPSQLVDQRPDIRATSALLHAASAQVGVATAAMLPQISLSGSAGSQALDRSDLFSAGTGVWSLGLNLTQPLFHGGELLHR
jgi:NodT family efflux transporter outer membrane factor (OMF) lipoprotein